MIDFGISPRSFREEMLERHVHLQEAALGREPFTWTELDGVLHQIEPVAPFFQLFNQGPVPEDRYTDQTLKLGAPRRRLDKRGFYSELNKGATLVINRFEDHAVRAKRLCGEVARFNRRQAIGNAYLSVGGRGTFGQHWDTHDVFALQLLGRKRWKVYPPTFPLPLGMHVSEGSPHACPADALLDCVLTAGDLLYIPRGWWHEAIPLGEPSLHLSVGTYGPTVHDFVAWACSRHLPQCKAARLSMDTVAGDADLGAAIEQLRSLVLEPSVRQAFERDIAGREVIHSEFNSELFLSRGADGLRADATVRLSSAYPLDLRNEEVSLNGARMKLHPLSIRILTALSATPSLTLECLYEELSREDPRTVRAALLDLARHDIVAIEQPS